MTKTLLPSWLPWLGLTTALVSAIIATQSFAAPTHVSKIGDFDVPILPRWNQKTLIINSLDKASYRREVQQNRIYISFTHLRILKDATQHMKDLQSRVTPNKTYVSTPKRYGGKIRVSMTQRVTSLYGMPAVLTQRMFKGKDARGKDYSATDRILNFAKGKQSYLLEANISSPSTMLSPQAQAELERAWKSTTTQIGAQVKR